MMSRHADSVIESSAGRRVCGRDDDKHGSENIFTIATAPDSHTSHGQAMGNRYVKR